jgi:hypothetical protein
MILKLAKRMPVLQVGNLLGELTRSIGELYTITLAKQDPKKTFLM